MKIIYKYPLTVGYQTIKMPEGAEILTAQIQRGEICIWAMVDPNKPIEEREIAVVGTGQVLPDEVSIFQYIATVQEGIYVWHILDPGAEG